MTKKIQGVRGVGLVVSGLALFFGFGANLEAVEIHKTITINVPIERAFSFWTTCGHFPQVMSHIREVRDMGNGQAHWIATGLAGVPIEWDSVTTQRIENNLLAWKTMPGSIVQHVGMIRFESNDDGSTRVTMWLIYSGWREAVATLLCGINPKTEMEEELARVKAFLEGEPAVSNATFIQQEKCVGKC